MMKQVRYPFFWENGNADTRTGSTRTHRLPREGEPLTPRNFVLAMLLLFAFLLVPAQNAVGRAGGENHPSGGTGEHRTEGSGRDILNGQWGTVCDDLWDNRDAVVACRQLGLHGGTAPLGRASFGSGAGPIYLDDVQCSGTEDRLTDCRSRPVGDHNCLHLEDAGVICTAANHPPVFTTEEAHRVFTGTTAVVTWRRATRSTAR